ncbi:MAG: alginate lyase family protein [Chloroflexi bacterium]|nr:alginate lyase family protein [Chloroflexota bacterium]
MLNRIKTLASLSLELGLRWSAFRLAYAFRLHSGLIRLQMPLYKWTDRPLAAWLKKNIPTESTAYAEWRKANAPKFFFDSLRPERSDERSSRRAVEGRWNTQTIITEADRILNGEIKFFSHEYHQVSFPPNWHQISASLPMPSSASDVNVKRAAGDSGLSKVKHWSQISDDGEVDIKFIWEPNRFAFVYTLVRAYAATKDEKYPQAFWALISDWAEHNPPNTGANWKDGQEIALRLMAWIFGFYAFIHSPSTTQLQITQFTNYLAAQAERIYKNIGYAISTRSNHTISEAFGLWMVGLLFPELNDSEKYFYLGKKLLEEEAAKQIFPDGSYAMYSLNYHRFILHLYLYAIQLGELNQLPFTNYLKTSISNSIQYLSRLIDPSTGQMPVYGSNDGALVLPLSNCDFTDYRPLLQLGSVITTGERMFESGEWDEDVFWLCGEEFTAKDAKKEERGKNLGDLRVISPHYEGGGEASFPDGGTYILRATNSRAIIHCTDYRSRPSHADQLHVDLLIHGHNIACDAGTYLYSGEGIWRNGLARTSAHNTVTVDGKDQMTLASRFTWTDWAKGKVLQQGENIWVGEHDGYKPVTHKRMVMALEGDRWLVIDHLDANEPHQYILHWLLSDAPFTENKNSIHLKYESSVYKVQTGLLGGEAKFSTVRADPNSTRGWRSRYYGHKEPAVSLLLEADQAHAIFWTFFGLGNDSIETHGNLINISTERWRREINLAG